MKWLVVVDMQADFIDGVLGSPAAKSIVPGVVDKILQAADRGDCVFATIDTHLDDYKDTLEGKYIPQHCIKGSDGWMLDLDVAAALNEVDEDKLRIIYKPTFGASFLLPEMWQQAQLYGMPDEIEFVGVCTGICVVSNVLLTKSEFYEQKISVDATCCACLSEKNT